MSLRALLPWAHCRRSRCYRFADTTQIYAKRRICNGQELCNKHAIADAPCDSEKQSNGRSTATTMEEFRKRYIKFEPEEMTSSLPPSPTPSSPRPTGRRYAMATELVFVDNPETGGTKDQYGASSMPIYQTATFKQTSASEMGEYDYTRSGNPTRSHLGAPFFARFRLMI